MEATDARESVLAKIKRTQSVDESAKRHRLSESNSGSVESSEVKECNTTSPENAKIGPESVRLDVADQIQRES